MMSNYLFGSMMGFGGLGLISMVLWWLLIIVGIVALARWLGRNNIVSGNPPSQRAIDVLKERYAKGEINKQEFEEKKKDII